MYGIGLAAEGINRGIEQHRQIGRQGDQDEQQRKLQDAQLENYGLQMDSTRQQMGHRDTEMGWKQDQQATLQAIQQTQNAIAIGDFETAGNGLAQISGFAGGRIEQKEDGFHAYFFDEDGDEPALETLLTQQELQHIASGRPEQIAAEAEADRRAVEQARAEAEKDRIEHQRKMEQEALKQGHIQAGFGEDGQFDLSNAPEGAMGGDPTANQKDVTDIMNAFGISRAEAWRMVKTAREEHPARAIREIASDLSRNSRQYRNDPDAAYKRATEIHQQITQGVRQGGGYGIDPSTPSDPDPLDQVTQGASQQISRQRNEQMLAEAEELAQENPADVARIAGLLVREGVMTEPEAQEWQRSRKAAGRRQPGQSPGIGISQFDRWQQR